MHLVRDKSYCAMSSEPRIVSRNNINTPRFLPFSWEIIKVKAKSKAKKQKGWQSESLRDVTILHHQVIRGTVILMKGSRNETTVDPCGFSWSIQNISRCLEMEKVSISQSSSTLGGDDFLIYCDRYCTRRLEPSKLSCLWVLSNFDGFSDLHTRTFSTPTAYTYERGIVRQVCSTRLFPSL